MNAKNQSVSTISSGAETSGESYVRSTGPHYLKISSVNTTWTITAEHLK